MDTCLLNQFNQAVDRADELVKCDLMAKAEAIKRFVGQVGVEEPRPLKFLNLFDSYSKDAALIAYLFHLLGFCLLHLEAKGKKSPHWVLAWYQKAHAWHLAVNLKFWKEPDDF